MFIAAYSAIGPESFLIQLKDQIAEQTLRRFASDFNIMAMCLSFRNERLVLHNPKRLFNNQYLQQDQTEDQAASDDDDDEEAPTNIYIANADQKHRMQQEVSG